MLLAIRRYLGSASFSSLLIALSHACTDSETHLFAGISYRLTIVMTRLFRLMFQRYIGLDRSKEGMAAWLGRKSSNYG